MARTSSAFRTKDHDPYSAGLTGPFNLSAQIKYFSHRVADIRRDGRPFDQVVIIGHSVGAYISLEVFHEHAKLGAANTPNPNLRAGILLFPTVSHLAESSNGKLLSRVRTAAFLDRNAHWLAKRFVDLWPASLLDLYIRHVMGFSRHGADATLKFLQSRDGIWQAIHLGKDEIRSITEDRWAEDFWEIADQAVAEKHSIPKFFFYFGKKDHWVSDDHRDAFIERRREHATRDAPRHKQGRTRIVIDEDQIPHAFCIRKIRPDVDENARKPETNPGENRSQRDRG